MKIIEKLIAKYKKTFWIIGDAEMQKILDVVIERGLYDTRPFAYDDDGKSKYMCYALDAAYKARIITDRNRNRNRAQYTINQFLKSHKINVYYSLYALIGEHVKEIDEEAYWKMTFEDVGEDFIELYSNWKQRDTYIPVIVASVLEKYRAE